MHNDKIMQFIHYILAFLWIYQGIFPKLLFTSSDEIAMWQFIGLTTETARLFGQLSGVAEIIFGVVFILIKSKYLHYFNILGLLVLLIGVAFILPNTLIAAFNPVVMNIAMLSLSVIALMLMQTQSTPQQD